MNNLLEVKNLKKYYAQKKGFLFGKKTELPAVDGVSFSLAEKETLAIVGESGSGKTTTALCAIRLHEPSSGELLFCGQKLNSLSRKEMLPHRREMQVVFQDPLTSLNPRKTILENIGEPLAYHKLVSNLKEKTDMVAETLQKVGISPTTIHNYPHQFSGGQRQRISIGRAIALKPKLVVCDEAISNLDLSHQAKILNLLLDLQEEFGLSYLFISHDLSTVRYFSDRVLVMYQGKIVEEGLTREVFENPQHPYTKLLLASLPKRHPQQGSAI